MLTEIKSKIFKKEILKFHKGLNVVLGDNKGSNSIGKSTLLMIVDFVFGGNSYISHNKDVIVKLGHHDFFFMFKFKEMEFYFNRGTEEPNLVFRCNENYEKLDEMKLDDYTKFLKVHYEIESKQLKFRAGVGTFSRVWGKNNYDVKRPLHNHHSEKNIETVIKLIKLFDEYDKIEIEDKELKYLGDTKKVLNKAGNLKLIPKITKKKYKDNIAEIETLQDEIGKLSKSAYSPIININDIVSEELIQLREHKKTLIEERDFYMSRLTRTNRTITKSTEVDFESLLEFFPDVNLEKLGTIEEFHNGITSILSNELKKARKELNEKIESLNSEINEINQRLEIVLNPNEEPNLFLDNLIEQASILKTLLSENDYFSKTQNLSESIASKTLEVEKIKEEIVYKIMSNINTKLKEINDFINEDIRVAPKLELTDTNYTYKFFENTGTGKAYTNLIMFDLAIFKLTSLPFIIHDSFLFKNIEKEVVEQLINYYNSLLKQTFISIDVIEIYNNHTVKILHDKEVIQLSRDNLLTKLDWRDGNK